MNYVLRNPPLVYRHQRAGRPTTYGAGRMSENNRHIRAVVSVHRLAEQLWRYVLQWCSRNCKKNTI
jgi:alpha-beta hydrolase superfamily lysophospholipase